MRLHHPPHIYLDNTWYMLSARTYTGAPFLASEQATVLVRDTLQLLIEKHSLSLLAWVILDNHHHHLLARSSRGQSLGHSTAQLHGSTARQLDVRDGVAGRQVLAQLLGYLRAQGSRSLDAVQLHPSEPGEAWSRSATGGLALLKLRILREDERERLGAGLLGTISGGRLRGQRGS